MKTFKATIVPTVAGGNIEVRVTANSASQAVGLIRTLPYFKSFVRLPLQETNKENNLINISELIKKANAKSQIDLATID